MTTRSPNPKTPVCVARALLPFDAHIVKNALEHGGVAATVQGEHSALSEIPHPASSVWVALEDEEAARALLAALEPTEGEAVVCSHCGELSDGDSETCPHCGEALATGPLADQPGAGRGSGVALVWLLFVVSNVAWLAASLGWGGGAERHQVLRRANGEVAVERFDRDRDGLVERAVEHLPGGVTVEWRDRDGDGVREHVTVRAPDGSVRASETSRYHGAR